MRYYLCIDLKTFYASVECVERRLDPFKTNLVVADSTRGNGALCLAISPKLKSIGVKNRCRLYEVPKLNDLIIATPRMKKYIDYSKRVYNIYLKYISNLDIHMYSIDEAFLDVTNYLNLYKMDAYNLAKIIIKDIYCTTGITATAGIGTNMYLAKIALDLIAKHSNDNIGFLDELEFKNKLWYHTPITDFWQIGNGIYNRLKKYHIKNMHDISVCNSKILYKEFGKLARILIDHSNGIETVKIKDIKDYAPSNLSISNSQILFFDYDYKDARKVLCEMIDNIVLELVKKHMYTNCIGFSIGYKDNAIKPLNITKRLDNYTNNYDVILNKLLDEYDYMINENIKIRRIGVYLSNLNRNKIIQINLFNENDNSDEELNMTLNYIKSKYGKNAILRAVSYDKNAMQYKRNLLIGGQNAE